jgi:hypothetical protein
MANPRGQSEAELDAMLGLQMRTDLTEGGLYVSAYARRGVRVASV